MFRFIFYIFNVLVILIFIKLFIVQDSYKKNNELNNKIELLENEYLRLLNEKSILVGNISSFKNNKSYQKHVIRKELGFIDETDKLYIFN